MNEEYDEVIHTILTRPDGVTEYVRIQDVEGNWIEVDITPENELEFKNPNAFFKPIEMRVTGRRMRKHIPVLDKTDSIEVTAWGRRAIMVRCRMNYDLETKPWKGGVTVDTPSESFLYRKFQNQFPSLTPAQIAVLVTRFRRRWVFDQLERLRRRRHRVARRKPDIPQESDME
jgi:hypothetical protein